MANLRDFDGFQVVSWLAKDQRCRILGRRFDVVTSDEWMHYPLLPEDLWDWPPAAKWSNQKHLAAFLEIVQDTVRAA
jgi:hypothetical protein